MKRELLNYDIYPKVFPIGKPVCFTIRPLGGHAAFEAKKEHTVMILTMNEGSHSTYPGRKNLAQYRLSPSEDGFFHLTHAFETEGEYYIRIMKDDARVVQLSVYAVEKDLVGRYPYMGDLHMHSTMSDGREHPYIVAANYRKFGYDFMALTDHRKFYPSLELMRFYEKLHLDIHFYTGEEIHLPGNDIHIVNFGGDYSVNGLLESSDQFRCRGADPMWRSVDGNCPPVLTVAEYEEQVNALAGTLNIPAGIEAFPYASCVWILSHIKKAHGLGIFAHPYWISNVYQVPESFTDYLFETHPFDAFEVFGGESYFEQNGFQTAKYYEFREKGIKVPIVGNTDSHGSTEYNPIMKTARTMVFAHENTRDALVDAIKTFYNVAIQDIGNHVEVLGDLRMMKYGWFLLTNYFPLHDELCFEEGRLMKAYACGDEDAGAELCRLSGRVQRLREKYFLFSE